MGLMWHLWVAYGHSARVEVILFWCLSLKGTAHAVIDASSTSSLMYLSWCHPLGESFEIKIEKRSCPSVLEIQPVMSV